MNLSSTHLGLTVLEHLQGFLHLGRVEAQLTQTVTGHQVVQDLREAGRTGEPGSAGRREGKGRIHDA